MKSTCLRTAAWAGGTHELAQETISLWTCWFWPARLEDVSVRRDVFKKGVWWVGKRKTGRAEGRPERAEVVVSSKAGHVPDHLSRRKDISLFAPIVPFYAETIKTTYLVPLRVETRNSLAETRGA